MSASNVTATELGANAVITSKIADSNVTTAKIADDAVTGDKIATNLDLPDNNKIRFGTGNDLEIYHSGTHSFIQDTGTGNLEISSSKVAINNAANNANMATFTNGGSVDLYHNGSKKFETTSSGTTITGRLISDGLNLGDGENLKLGSDDDCLIEHTGTVLEIDNNTGGINMDSTDTIQLRVGSNETAAKFIPNGAVELYYNNYKAYVTNGGGGPSNGMLSADSVLNLNTSQDGSGSDYFVRGSKNSTVVGGGNDVFWIYEDGDMYNVNGTFSQSSDIKLKENIVDASSQWSDIKALKVRKFNFKASTGYGTHTQIGMVAQEVETTCPGTYNRKS